MCEMYQCGNCKYCTKFKDGPKNIDGCMQDCLGCRKGLKGKCIWHRSSLTLYARFKMWKFRRSRRKWAKKSPDDNLL